MDCVLYHFHPVNVVSHQIEMINFYHIYFPDLEDGIGERGGRLKKEVIMYNYGWICIVVQQKPTQHSIAIFPQLKIHLKKKVSMHIDIYFGNPFQYSCQYNPMDRGAWQAIVHGVTKSQTQLK